MCFRVLEGLKWRSVGTEVPATRVFVCLWHQKLTFNNSILCDEDDSRYIQNKSIHESFLAFIICYLYVTIPKVCEKDVLRRGTYIGK